MVEIEIEVTTELWRTADTTFVVMYSFPNVAYIKGLRGKFDIPLRKALKKKLQEKGITTVHYERRKEGETLTMELQI